MTVPRRKPLTGNVVIISVGLDTYWKQFPGLLEELERKEKILEEKLARYPVTVTYLGMVDNSRKAS